MYKRLSKDDELHRETQKGLMYPVSSEKLEPSRSSSDLVIKQADYHPEGNHTNASRPTDSNNSINIIVNTEENEMLNLLSKEAKINQYEPKTNYSNNNNILRQNESDREQISTPIKLTYVPIPVVNPSLLIPLSSQKLPARLRPISFGNQISAESVHNIPLRSVPPSNPQNFPSGSKPISLEEESAVVFEQSSNQRPILQKLPTVTRPVEVLISSSISPLFPFMEYNTQGAESEFIADPTPYIIENMRADDSSNMVSQKNDLDEREQKMDIMLQKLLREEHHDQSFRTQDCLNSATQNEAQLLPQTEEDEFY